MREDLYPMERVTFAIACACCKHRGKDAEQDRCLRCKAEAESGFEMREHLTVKQRWIPVTERLPENDERVLAWGRDWRIHDMTWSWVQNEWLEKRAFDKSCGFEVNRRL